MSKEVEAVISLRTRLVEKGIKDEFLEELIAIETALKALDIMKQQLPNLLLIRNTRDYDEFLEKSGDNLTEKEYSIVNAVLL